VRSAALHGLSLSLARQPCLVAFSRALVRRVAPRDRLGRIAAVFSFVSQAVDLRMATGVADPGLSALMRIAGPDQSAALVLCAMLKALGERARVERTRELAFVRVDIDLRDVARLPPHTLLLVSRGAPRYSLPLDARRARSPLGFLPKDVRLALARRRGLAAASFTAA
jgi:hypothetical protein